MSSVTDCVFCKLLAGELEVTVVHRDGLCTAIMDIQPITPGHMLVIPNRHATYLSDLVEDEGAQMFRIAHRLAAAVRHSRVKCEGVNLFLADGEAAGQEVFHTHLHVFPRFAGDGFGLQLPSDYTHRPERTELDQIAERIQAALKQT